MVTEKATRRNGAPAAAPSASANQEDEETQARHRAIEERALEAARKRVQITVYTTAWCPHCARAKKWLTASQISFQEVDIEKSDAGKRKMREINPGGGVPTFEIEGEVTSGFSESSVKAAMERAARKLARL